MSPLSQLRDHIDDILDVMEDGIFVSDHTGMAIHVNKAYEQISGLSVEDLRGSTVQELQRRGTFNKILNPEIVRTKQSASVVQEVGKGKKTIHLRGFPILDDEGEVRFVVTFARDVTAITQLREQIAEQRRVIEQYQGSMAKILSARYEGGIIAGAAMQKLLQLLVRVAETDATVLLLGETGVGKDVLARMVHLHSPRKDKMFLKVDCGSIAENLIESELFGYVRGAFSGADNQGRAGYFEMADKGTVFLDEIGELPLPMQSKLLRILQDNEFMRVGSSRAQKVDVRIIAATNRDLAAEVERDKFRQDLYYRLNVAKLNVPALRERGEDIPLLARHFLDIYNAKYKKHTHLSGRALQLFSMYSWPGNVRELQNLMQQLVITSDHELLDLDDLPMNLRENETTMVHVPFAPGAIPGMAAPFVLPETPTALKETMAGIERTLLLEALRKHGSVTKVANLFKINRTTLFRKLQRGGRSGTSSDTGLDGGT